MSDKEVYNTAMAGYQSALIQEQAAFQQAQISGDLDEQVRASQSMASLRSQAKEYQALASEHARSIQAAQPMNRFGLSPEEIEIAHKSFSTTGATKEEKERLYAENRAKLHRMRSTGEYRMTTDATG